jgi:hypothetical protein
MSNVAISAEEIVEDDAEEESINDDEVVRESIHDKVTNQSFAEMITRAATGRDLLPIIDLLPDSSQCYGHSITMNAVMNSAFRDNFYTLKVEKVKETKVRVTYKPYSLK